MAGVCPGCRRPLTDEQIVFVEVPLIYDASLRV